MKVLFSKAISDHPLMEGVNRTVDTVLAHIDGYNEKMDIRFIINNFKDGVLLYTNQLDEIIDNNRTMLVRDENFEPVPNPDYIEPEIQEGEEESNPVDESLRYLTAPAFNYLIDVLFTSPAALSVVVGGHISEMDADGKFD